MAAIVNPVGNALAVTDVLWASKERDEIQNDEYITLLE